MSETAVQALADDDLMAEVTRLAKIAPHKLSADMTGAKRLTVAQARQICGYLARRIAEPGQARAQATAPDVSRETRPAPHRPGVPPPMSAFRGLPVGFYATPSRTGSNDFDFWKIKRPEKGKWAGYTFVNRVLGGGSGETMRTVSVPNMEARLACQAIVEFGTEKAQAAFADNLDRCIDCGRDLTDGLSRSRRKGPDCFGKSISVR